jgi:hypothetical protein
MMLLKAPTEITEAVIEGTLTVADPADEAVVREARGDRGERSIGRDLPVVSIGQPESWPVSDLLRDARAPLIEASPDHEFRLVRLACSFRPKGDDPRIEWARFAVQLLPDASGRQPVAFDMHPLAAVHEVKRNFKVSLSPSIKFTDVVEASLGGVEAGLEYPELLPMVSGSGIGETTPSWDYLAVRGTRVAGVRCMHLIARMPRGTGPVTANLELTAEMVGNGFRIPVVLRRQHSETERLEVRLWN